MPAAPDQTGTEPGAPDVPSPEPAHAAEPPPGEKGNLLVGLLKLARPKQWAKNLLVFAAPGAAGVLDDRTHLAETLVAFLAMCLAAAGTYYINDARDAEADRLHPKKRFRPVAVGTVPVPLAFATGFCLLAAGVLVTLPVDFRLTVVVASYVALTTAYSAVLKRYAVLDLVAISGGFVLRAVAGAAATDVPISNWFFIVTVFASLFVVAGKRGAEAREMGEDAVRFRTVLGSYTESFTSYLRSVTSSAMLIGYCVWAVEKADEIGRSTSEHPWFQMSILPFLMGVLRYAQILDDGRGSAPEEILLKDRALQLIGLAWVAVFALGVYTA
jgi:decaprenyl-phosphate phosphoribosyltransferase